MLDIKYIIKNQDKVKQAAKDKNIDLDINQLISLDKKRKDLLQKVDDLRKKRNEIANNLKDPKKRSDKLISDGKKIKNDLTKFEKDLRAVQEDYNKLMLMVPNVPSKDTPVGSDESGNIEVRNWGKIPKFDFKMKDHVQLGKDLDLIDLERGTKVSGFRGYILKNDAVLLHWAILTFALQKLIKEGFTPMIPTVINKERVLINSGHFPWGKPESYQIVNAGKLDTGEEITDKMFLAGTSEPPLVSYYQEEVLAEKDLPVKFAGFSPCYRSEVGSYGKDTKGLFRIHEFMKIEQVVFCKNDEKESLDWLEKMTRISEEILQDLKLPYRVMQMCTGDMGEPQYKKYDIETWMPSRESYGETHSASAILDFQARRANIKYKDKKGKLQFVHTLNNTAIASPRILIAIIENYQQKDGSIKVPDVLIPYMGKGVIKK